ncbi:MAG: cytochrome c [Methylobacteriaceae bacterium]|nr:cytochrome c [Methylobacteriaceae bacterium]
MRRIFFSVLLIAALAAAALFFATHLTIPEDRAQRAFAPDLIKRGGELAALGYCASCHTEENCKPFAGGRPLATPFGTIYGTNITPDVETGIGQWSQAAFNRAMRDGVDRAGRDLYPAFPYDHFTKLTDEDLSALYAFLMTREPVHAPNRANELAFPYNVRPLLAGWKLLYMNKEGVPRGDGSKSAKWDHGAYLVEALSHCGACHTPRDRLGAEIASQHFDGGEAEDWWVPPLNRTSPALVPWNEESLFNYLSSWDAGHGGGEGPMKAVVSALATAPEQDVRAIAVYIASMLAKPEESEARADDKQAEAAQAHPAGAQLYAGICATCHETGGHVPFTVASLGQHTSLHAPDPRNVIHVILEGIHPSEGTVGAIMPSFADALGDSQVAEIVSYLRARFSGGQQWSGVEQEAARIRSEGTSP